MNERTLQNFRAFAKLYGYVRFFHPSDEASSIDWDKFAVYGFEKVENASGDNELKDLLLELFLPIAPTIEVYLTDEEIKYDLKKIIPADTTGLLPVAWQHLGIQTNQNNIYNIYKSVRVNRIPVPINHSAILSRKIDAAEFMGKRIKIQSGIKIPFEDKDSSGELWVKTYKTDGKEAKYSETHFTVDKWNKYEAEIDVLEDDSWIEYGVRLNNEGVIYINGFSIEAYDNGNWSSKELIDGKFELQKVGNTPENWNITDSDYIYEIIDFDTYDNDKACFIQSNYIKQPFEKYPMPGELINKPISNGLSCIIPLALYSDNSGTLPHAHEDSLNNVRAILEENKYSELSAENKYVRLAGAAKLWNIIQHSFPYFDNCTINWDDSLNSLLKDVFPETDKNGFINCIYKVTSFLNDGHIGMTHPDLMFKFFYPPFILDHAEGKFVISRIFEDNTGLLEGDVITEIDGISIDDASKKELQYISTSTFDRRIKNILYGKLLKCEKDSDIDLKINRNGEELSVSVKRNYNMRDFLKEGLYPEYRPEKISELRPGIFYADITRLTTEELDEKIPELAIAKGVIFDVRGYPKLGNEFLNHLSDQKLFSAHWNVPRIIYPDREKLNGYDTTGRWETEPLLPRFKGRIVFMTDGGAISYAESIMGIVEAYKLGIIVGEPTAGTNGNVNPIELPGGYTVRFTGMKVLKHDGSPHHGVGIIPDVPVKRTIKGICEKRDEYLEKALEIIENAK
jgi:C-terminal processing protease CtpA/Prc